MKTISLDQIKELISIYRSFDQDFFNDNDFTIDQMLVWIHSTGHVVVTLPSDDAINDIKKKRLSIDSWRQIFLDDPEGAIKWIKIKESFRTLNTTPSSQINKRITLANTLFEKIHEDKEFKAFIFSHKLISREYILITQSLLKIIGSRHEPLEESARNYFGSLYSRDHIIHGYMFSEKENGQQLGRKLTITYSSVDDKNEKNISFFIKTHQYGYANNHISNNVHPIDPKELFVYKVLEYIGCGPKVHFIPSSSSDDGLYIATQDCGFTKSPGKTKFFETCSGFREQLEKLTALTEETKEVFSLIDILSRIFRLSDITTNPDNFGPVIINGKVKKWKIIDFKVSTYRHPYGYDNIFEGFRQTNGMYYFGGLLGQILRDRPEDQRLSTANRVIQAFKTGKPYHKMPLLEAIQKAFDAVNQYIDVNAQRLNITASSKADLVCFRNAAICNFQSLSTGIEQHLSSEENRPSQISP